VGATQCVGTVVYACGANSQWAAGVDCATSGLICSGGTCTTSSTDGDVEITDNDNPTTCTNGQKQCIGTVIYTCNSNTWNPGTDCSTTAQTCSAGACVGGGTDGDVDADTDTSGCTSGDRKCVGDMVYQCTGGVYQFSEDCASQSKTCNAGVCEGGSTGDQCASGLTCTDVTGGGYMGCLTSSGGVPSGAQTNCGDSGCTGNATCFCQDSGCTATVCIGNCGTCVSGLTCTDVTGGGYYGCLTSSGGVPSGAQTNCGDSGCTGNATCFCQDSGCTATVCIGNCAAGSTTACTNGQTKCVGNVVYTCNTSATWIAGTDCTTSGKTCSNGACVTSSGGGCASGLTCVDVTGGGHMGCLTSSGGLPSGAQTNCGDSGCTGNATCFCQDSGCTATVCIGNCGSCASGLTCTDVTGGGYYGCLTSSGGVPSGAQTNCGDSGCTGNATCFCQDSGCTATVCIGNCSL